jgi:hypothetical protein
MGKARVVNVAVAVGFLLAVLSAVSPPAHAAWVNGAGTQFQVGGQLSQITPTLPTLPVTNPPPGVVDPVVNPACGADGGTSLAVVQGLKLDGIDPSLYPVALVASCLDSSVPANRARLNFINPITVTALVPPSPGTTVTVQAGTVVKQITTKIGNVTAAPGTGWAHLVNRQDKGDLLGCGSDGSLYSIDYSRTTALADGTATLLTSPAAVTSCRGLAWDADADVIYVGTSSGTANNIVRLFNNTPTTTTLLGTFPSPCNVGGVITATKGLAISGGVLLVSCEGNPLAVPPIPPHLTIGRIDKNTGVGLGVHGSLTATGLPVLASESGLSSLTCDPVTFHKDANGKDLFTDALWSRLGADGNTVVALEFPAYTCGMPPSSVVTQAGVPYSPLAAGFGAPGSPASTQPGAVPRTACFNTTTNPGRVIDVDNDGLPDCWETSGIDFGGTGVAGDLLTLCVQVNTNGDGVTLTTECALTTQKDLFVEIDYMEFHKPDPLALSQTQSPLTRVKGNPVGVKSVREAFAAAPVGLLPGPVAPVNPLNPRTGVKLHMQVDEQVTFHRAVVTSQDSPTLTSHVDQVAFTPCTGPVSGATVVNGQTSVVDFDDIKKDNFGTAAERNNQNAANKLNAKRLAFRYVVFAHTLVGNPSGGSNGSGCSETGGDDGVITLGSFVQTTVNGVSHKRGTTDQQAGTFMHEFGHLLGFGHGGADNINCKPNYRSVMSYSRQFAGSPIQNRRLDYSRSADPVLADPFKTGVLNQASLNEGDALGTDSSRGPIGDFFPQADTIVFGPGTWASAAADATSINWNRSGTTPESPVSANINLGPPIPPPPAPPSCDGGGDLLEGQDDWSNVLYRPSAAINFAGGESAVEMTSDDERAFFEALDRDGNRAADKSDCGGTVAINGTPDFQCSHRIALPDGIAPPANFRIVIFSETNGTNTWNAPTQIVQNDKNGIGTCPTPPANGTTDCTLTVSVGDVVIHMKTPADGTCSAQHMPDPDTLQVDGIKDAVCQAKTSDQPLLPHGTVFVIVSGFFIDNSTIPSQTRAFSARREVTIP